MSQPERDLLASCLLELRDQVADFDLVLSDDSLPPPPQAVCQGTPRLHTVLGGCKRLRTAQHGAAHKLALTPGTWLYTTPYGWTEYDWSSVERTFAITVHHGFVRYLLFDHDGSFDRNRHPRAPDYVYHSPAPLSIAGRHLLAALDALARGTSARATTAHLVLRSLIDVLLEQIEHQEASPDPSHALWHRAVAYLHDHAQEPIDRRDVADAMGLHPNSLSRLFAKHDAEGFQQRLTRLRLEHSLLLLRDHALSLETIAARSGFGSGANYFIRVFKQAYGLTPGRYRALPQGTPPPTQRAAAR
ncbi:MAG: AraC family transcriptional regulator [Planctomycetota bacterium]|jgi:AraC-like DNA-binding protein|nr:AraC family transcriptional regulator [Planctomycetota bacterium]